MEDDRSGDAWIGGAVGTVSAFGGAFYGPIGPATYIGIMTFFNSKVQDRAVSDPKLKELQAYVDGYERSAKNKKVRNFALGSLVGLGVGFRLYQVTFGKIRGMIRQITNTFVYGSIWVALCATALAWLTLFEDGIVVGIEDALWIEWKVLVFVFSSTLIIYNLNMASGLAALRKQGTESERHHWCRQ